MVPTCRPIVTRSDLLERVDHRAYRLLLLRAHYRSPLLVDTASIGAAERRLDRLDRWAIEADLDPEVPLDQAALEPWVAAVEDDLNTVRALELVFDWARAWALVQALCTVVGSGAPDAHWVRGLGANPIPVGNRVLP